MRCKKCKTVLAFKVAEKSANNSADNGDVILKGQIVLIKPGSGEIILKCPKCKTEVVYTELILVRK